MNTTTNNKSLASKVGSFNLGGISLPEIAILGAAGYVLWRNREKIESLLTDNGIEVPAILTANVGDIVQSFANKSNAGVPAPKSQKTFNTERRASSSEFHDA